MDNSKFDNNIESLSDEQLNDVAGGTNLFDETQACPKHHGCSNSNGFACVFLTNKSLTTHIVVWGHKLQGIAACAGTDMGQIQRWNNIADPSKIYVGQKLRIR